MWRRVWVILCLLTLCAEIAGAGVIGRVETIGFESLIRSDRWVPVHVQITSDDATPQDYQLQVVQHDLDGDDVVYARPVIVNPGTETFWTYFKPESIQGGLSVGPSGASDLSKRLRIYLATPDGAKRVVQLSVAGAAPIVLDETTRDKSDKLMVIAGRRLNTGEFDAGKKAVFGLAENVVFASIKLRTMPDNVLGYDAVDAVIWTDLEVDQLASQQFRALRQYVERGGTLVVLQHPEAARMAKLNEFLPVQVGRVETTTLTEPLRTLLLEGVPENTNPETGRRVNWFANATGPFRMARSQALPDAIVPHWIDWPDGSRTPYIARHLYGMGMVVWVAQDVSDPSVRNVELGWPNFWAKVLDWPLGGVSGRNTYDYMSAPPSIRSSAGADTIFHSRWRSTGSRDIGASFADNVNIGSKTITLISLAFAVFIIYWVAAGPGAYLVLAAKKRVQWSWFIYGATALVATGLTVLLGRLVLQGDAEVRHVSLVRARSDGSTPARVQSRFGIYLPEDRPDTAITLTQRDPSGPAVITPLVKDARHTQEKPNIRDSRYTVPIVNEDVGESVTIEVPFRSTLKKLSAEWTGPPAGRVAGLPRLIPGAARLAGSLSNNTGRDLANVLLVFDYPLEVGSRKYVLYQRLWPNGQTLDLSVAMTNASRKLGEDGSLALDDQNGSAGDLASASEWLYRGFRSGMSFDPDAARWDDSSRGYRQSFPIASLFSILPPMQNPNADINRSEIIRRGVRDWDMSHVVSAGALLVIGQSNDDDIPLPLTVEGQKPVGSGTTFWQFVVPLDRSQVNQLPATSQPVEANP